jgi:ribose transport system ATP-binding protein
MNMISGVLAPDGGEIRLDGTAVSLGSPKHAQNLGVGTVFQELSLVPALSIAENMFANRPPTNPAGLVRWTELYRRARELLTELNLGVDVRRSVASVDAGTRQLVEIAKALSLQARVLLLDEPTSALTPHDVETLFGLLRRLRAAGMTIVYVSHQMREVFAIADRITVMRDGRKVGTWRTEETSASDVIRHMVGRDVIDERSRSAINGGQRLAVEGLAAHGHFRDVNFAVREGEIVGLAGLIGSGRSELARVIGGARRADRGRVRIDRRAVSFRSVRDAMRCGVAYLPGERKTEGLFLSKSLGDNIVAPSLGRVASFGVINRSKCKRMASEVVRLLRIRAAGIGQPVGRLSGGNQQKVLLGKWLTIEPRILVVDEPTKGVDVAAKSEIHEELRRLATRGAALLIVSSDLPELLLLCDRILIMRQGELVADLAHEDANEEVVMARAAGLQSPAEFAS